MISPSKPTALDLIEQANRAREFEDFLDEKPYKPQVSYTSRHQPARYRALSRPPKKRSALIPLPKTTQTPQERDERIYQLMLCQQFFDGALSL